MPAPRFRASAPRPNCSVRGAMRPAQSVLALALVVEMPFAMAQEPICNPCVDGPEMFEHRSRELSPYLDSRILRGRNQREATTLSMGWAISETDLLAYASRPYDKAGLARPRVVVLGILNGIAVVVEHWCSDVCADHSVRVIHFFVPPGPSCTSVDGVAKSLNVPTGVAVSEKTFCFPRI